MATLILTMASSSNLQRHSIISLAQRKRSKFYKAADIHWVSMVGTDSDEHPVQTMETRVVRLAPTPSVQTRWCALSGHSHHENTCSHQFAPVCTSSHQFAPVCTSLHQFAPFKAVFSCGGRNLCCSLYFIASGLHSCWIPLPRSFVTFRVMKFLYLLIALQIFQVISDTFWKYSGVICETVSSIPRNIYCFIGRR